MAVVCFAVVWLPNAWSQGSNSWSYHGLRKFVEVSLLDHDDHPLDSVQPRLQYRLHHREAMINPAVNGDVLIRTVDVPAGANVRVMATVRAWARVPSVPAVTKGAFESLPTDTLQWIQTRRLGGLQDRDRWMIQITPWVVRNSIVMIADSIDIHLTVEETAAPVGQMSEAPTMLFDPDGNYVVLSTQRDGIAVVKASTVLAVAPQFESVPIDSLALLYKGSQQAMSIMDDGDGLLSRNDTLLFQGRRPSGDTIWYDRHNTKTNFFLTDRLPEPRRRFSARVSGNPQAVSSLSMRRHIEFDTGYYHLGNAFLEDFADYYTPWAFLEGYYWENLNARAYQRAAHRFRFTPAPGSLWSVSARYISGSAAPAYTPDSRADLSLNGSATVSNVTDGFGSFEMLTRSQSVAPPSAIQSVKLFATGIDSVRNRPDYVSQTVLDYYEVTGSVLPILDSGSIHATVESPSGARFAIWNARTPRLYMLDTVNQNLTSWVAQRKGHVLRVGITPADRDWPTVPHDTTVFRASALIGDHALEIDSINEVVIAFSSDHRTWSVYQWPSQSDQIRSVVGGLTQGAAYVVWNPAKPVTDNLREVLRGLQISVPSPRLWCGAGFLLDTVQTWSSDVLDGVGGSLCVEIPSGTTYVSEVATSDAPVQHLFLADANALELADVRPAKIRDLVSGTPQTDMIVVTHPALRAQAERLAQHRRSFSKASVQLFSVDEIIDSYGAGDASPEVIRAFLAELYKTIPAPKPRYLLLVGNASWDARRAIPKGNAGSRRADLVPTYGRPSSDYYFGLLDDVSDVAVPELIVGRIPALTDVEAKNHVDKIIAMDTAEIGPWVRRWLFVGGGAETEGLCDLYKDMINDPFQTGVTFTEPPLCLDTVTICSYEQGNASGYLIKQTLDRGVQWMNYIGHGATDQFDIRGWEPSELLPSSNYGVLATYACQTGAFSNPSVSCKNADYLSAPDVGFAAAVGGTGWARRLTISYLHFRVHELLRNTTLRTLGDLVYEAKVPFSYRGDQDGINTTMQFCLLGDPMSRLRIDTVPEAYLRHNSITVRGENGQTELTDEEEYAIIEATIDNAGTGTTDPIDVMLIRTYEGKADTLSTVLDGGLCTSEHVQFLVPIYGRAGDHRIVVLVDPQGRLGDDPADNSVSTNVRVVPRSMLPLQPLPHGTLSSKQPRVRILDPLSTAEAPYQLSFTLLRGKDTLAISQASDLRRDQSIVDWYINENVAPLPKGYATVIIQARDTMRGQTAAALHIPVVVTDSMTDTLDQVAVSAADLRRPIPANIAYDTTQSRMTLSTRTLPIYVRSRGVRTADIFTDRMIQVRLGDILYVDNPFYRGVNVIVLSETDTVPTRIRRYDTYWDPDPTPGWHNGTSKECITFLRDSVNATDRVILAVAYESFSGFERDSTLSEFQALVTSMGSAYADSLVERCSWTMIGRKGSAPGSVPEQWAAPADSLVTLLDSLTFTSPSGTVQSPWIGPGRGWGVWTSTMSPSGAEVTVHGRRRAGDEVLLQPASQEVVWDGRSLPEDITSIRFTYDLALTSNQQPWIASVHGTFLPADEWLMEPMDVTLTPTVVLRGDTAVMTCSIRNARYDRSTSPTTLIVTIPDETGSRFETRVGVDPIAADSRNTLKLPIVSSRIASAAIISVDVNPESAGNENTETYTFNNRRERLFTVAADTVPPTIGLFVDGRDLSGGGFVPFAPMTEVVLRDNSYLTIADPSRLIVFVNGDRIRSAIADSVEFIPTEACRTRYSDPTIRAALRFRYPLEIGDNNVLVRASDASGNPQEALFTLRTSTSTRISDVRIIPQPFVDVVDFSMQIETSQSSSTVLLDLYDAQGRRIRTITSNVTGGTSTVQWDGRSDDGASVPSGIYAYHIRVIADGSATPSMTSGTLVKMR